MEDEVAIVYARVWGDDKPPPDVRLMREALVKTAIDITHEAGDLETTRNAYANTVQNFLTEEADWLQKSWIEH